MSHPSGCVLNIGSLFSGIGGMDLGLERAGHRVVFQCESDPWRRSVLADKFDGGPCYEDIREVASGWGVRPVIDLLCGGFPCQDVSIAGKRAGIAGERTGLFWEFIRVARSLRPSWLLLENVPGLLSSHAGRDFGAVLGALVELGYGVAWRIIDSQYFGVPQRRRRVFIIGCLADGDPRAAAERAAEVLAIGSRCERHPTTGGEKEKEVAGSLGGGASRGRGYCDDLDRCGALIKRYGKGTDSDATDALVVGQQDATVRRLTPTECERLQGFPDGWTAMGPDLRRYAALGDAVTVNVAEWIGRGLP